MRKGFLWGVMVIQFLMADGAFAMWRSGGALAREAFEMGQQLRSYAQRIPSPPQPRPGSLCANRCEKVCGGYTSCRFPRKVAQPGLSLSDLAAGYLVYTSLSGHYSSGSRESQYPSSDSKESSNESSHRASNESSNDFGDD